MKTIQWRVRLPLDVDKRLRDFCRRTRRAEGATLAAIAEIFFAVDDVEAERRLVSNLWDESQKKAVGGPIRPPRGSTRNDRVKETVA